MLVILRDERLKDILVHMHLHSLFYEGSKKL